MNGRAKGNKEIQVPDLSAWSSLQRGCARDSGTCAPTVKRLSRGEEAFVCLACGLSCILQKDKGGGRNLEERKEAKLGGWSGEDEQCSVRAKGEGEVLQEEGKGKEGRGRCGQLGSILLA